jgi:hypothetical protein
MKVCTQMSKKSQKYDLMIIFWEIQNVQMLKNNII